MRAGAENKFMRFLYSLTMATTNLKVIAVAAVMMGAKPTRKRMRRAARKKRHLSKTVTGQGTNRPTAERY